jgi:hypothetical protein
MRNEPENGYHVTQTIATYDAIAPNYILTATPEMRAWEEKSMRMFNDFPKRKAGAGSGLRRRQRFTLSVVARASNLFV